MKAPSFSPVHQCGLIGSGGHARIVSSALATLGIKLVAVVDTAPDRIGQVFSDIRVQEDLPRVDLPFHIAIGSNGIRRRVAETLKPDHWLTVIHRQAQVASGAVIGDGCLVGMGAMVQSDSRTGRHVIVNTGAIVEHDCLIGDFAHIAPGAVLAGAVTVGEEALIGAGAVILPGLTIGAGAIVGAGAVVTRSVEPGQTVIGSPARSVGS